MATIGERLQKIMSERKMSKAELCERANIGKVSLERYITDDSLPDTESLNRIAAALFVSVDYIVGKTDAANMSEPMNKVPILSEFPDKVTSKEDLRAFEAIGHITGNYSKKDMELCYFVIAKDDSMIYAKIGAGDKVLINPAATVESGGLAAVKIEDRDPEIRRVYIKGDKIEIRTESILPRIEEFDIKDNKVTFLGSVVFIISYPV